MEFVEMQPDESEANDSKILKGTSDLRNCVTFYAIGDWGEPTSEVQGTAESMARFASLVVPPRFILGLGDNIYPSGVECVDDIQFKEKWEDIFLKFRELRVPWKMTLGNHDYRGNPWAQIEYSSHSSNPDGLWQFPALNYSFNVPLSDTADDSFQSIDFFEIDTNGVQSSVTSKFPQLKEDIALYIAELSQKLAASTAKWKIVFGHHPMYTQGLKHGLLGRNLKDKVFKDMEGIEKNGYGLEDVLAEHGVDAYISGHEHRLQYHFAKGIHNFIVGAAGVKNRLYGGHDHSWSIDWMDATNSNGFLSVTATVDDLVFKFLSSELEILKEVVITK
jgi:acid phosphatase